MIGTDTICVFTRTFVLVCVSWSSSFPNRQSGNESGRKVEGAGRPHRGSYCQNDDFPPGSLSPLGPAQNWWCWYKCVCVYLSVQKNKHIEELLGSLTPITTICFWTEVHNCYFSSTTESELLGEKKKTQWLYVLWSGTNMSQTCTKQ